MKKMYFWLNCLLIRVIRLMLKKIRVWHQKIGIKLIKIKHRELSQVSLKKKSDQKLLLLELNKILISLSPMKQIRNRSLGNHMVIFHNKLNKHRGLVGNIVLEKKEIIQK